MNRLKLLIVGFLLSSLVSLIHYSALAQCFTYYTLSPSGNVSGGSAAMVLSGSQAGVSYQLHQINGSDIGSPVIGNGSSISLGTVTSSGGVENFTVIASSSGSGCYPTVIGGSQINFLPPMPSGTVSATSSLVCPTGPVTFTVNPTVPAQYTYQWFQNGVSISNNSPTYSTTVAASYTVQVSNSTGMVTLTCPAITASPSVGQPGAVTGPISRIAGAGSSTYTCGAANNAAAYNYQVSPTLAGSFSGFGSTTTFTWNPSFYGTAIISVTAAGNCGLSSNPSLLPVSVDLPSSSTYSYMEETDVRVPNIISASAITTLPIGQKEVTYTYQDQIGRPIQKVMQSASPGLNDVVQPMAYDPAGRQITSYLPYSAQGASNGSYKANPLTNQAVYYNPNTPGAPNIATSINSTSQSNYDNSPLERRVEQGYPGSTWIQGGGHTVLTSYGTNATAEVTWWIYNPVGGAYEYSSYNAGSLLTSTVTDENGHTVTQYTDFNGKMVCKKVQSTSSTYLYTYYIYDDADNLRYVIPPLPTVPVAVALSSSFAETDAVFNNFIYGYHYDGRNRLIEKKVPGKGWEYYVYNKLDQVILSQTPTQLSLGVWIYTKYDAKGRAILTGDYTISASRSTLQSTADSFSSTLLWENFTNVATNYGYTDVSYPDNTVSSSKKVLSVSYYDTYAFLSNSTINPNTSIFTVPVADTIYNSPEGLPTGSITNVVGATSPTYLLNITQYDTYGRVVKTVGQSFVSGNSNSGNYDIVQNQYSFSNLLIKSTRTNYVSSVLNVTTNTYYQYDLAGRKILLQQQYNSGPLISLAKYDYNELGQLITKNLQSTSTTGIPASSSFLQHINYKYNIRGWLNYINNPASTSMSDPAFPSQTDLFAEEIDYDQPNAAFSGITPQYNGNISTVSWQTLADPNTTMVQELKGYVFSYDGLNRLNSAMYKAPSGNDKYDEVVSYDELGNILSLNRNTTASTYLNKLTYDYGTGTQRGNTLLDVTDNGGTENYTSTFSYQTSGSETGNTKMGVQQITYNVLNLPSLITFTTGKTINFMYSSTGEEFERLIKQGPTISEDRSYVHGIEYVGSAINFIHTEEGRARPSSSGYMLEYQVTDHLGNVRALFGDENNNGSFSASNDIVQTTDYYAFGRAITYLDANPQFQYKFNGKEYSSDLNEYNYGARYFNPVTARWNGVDNAAEKSRRWSPYVYAINNPIRNIDPDGNLFEGYNMGYAIEENLMIGNIYSNAMSTWSGDLAGAMLDEKNQEEGQLTRAQEAYGRSGYMRDIMEGTGLPRGSRPDCCAAGGSGGGDLFQTLNSGASGEGFNWNGFSNAIAHLTPFGGAIDFTNSARNGDVGGAVLAIASSAAFFTGEGDISSIGRTNTVESSSGGNMATLYRNMGQNEFNATFSGGDFNGFSISPNNFQGKQFWIGEPGLNFWNGTSFSKPFNIQITIPESYITPTSTNYLFMEKGDPFFNGMPSIDNHPGGTVLPGNLNLFNSVISSVTPIKWP